MAAGNPGPVVPERYVKALDGADPVESQRKAPKRIKKLLRGLSEKELTRRPAPDKWSIKEVIAHLADGEVVLGSRLRFVAAMDRPPILGYDQDAFVERLGIERVKTAALFDAFAAVRAANVNLMDRLADDAWKRIGLHSERGEESIATMVVMYAGHDRIHEQQIDAIRATLKAEKSATKGAARAAKVEKKLKKQEKKARKQARKSEMAASAAD